ncbi:protein Wnt-2b-A-like [Parasteatoda tepidariorum]|uniref:Protein Wnt n=1 Tax=Parasteatoda tepidariorum TaxID=114398 RepID=Q75PH4_PARTP|nr:protein Wnt-2b-A-like [Parasteatoda tepidariorum]BAD12591.1 Wnt2 [Parasteatoda tepidariorum]
MNLIFNSLVTMIVRLKIFLSARIAVVILMAFCCPQGVIGSWWLLSRLQVSSALFDTQMLCGGIPGLARKQREICEQHPDILLSVTKGARIGVSECQAQFRNQRWNCSTLGSGASVFGSHMLKVDSRESAFLYAISSAGVTHAIIRSCSRGEIPNCPCDPLRRGFGFDPTVGGYSWGGCSHISAGVKFARQFIDAREDRRKDARALMNFHNNRAGRKAVQKKTRLQCKCHGVSGSCASRTCWSAQMEFREVGRLLKRKYEGAVQVTMSNQMALVSVDGTKPYTKLDLIYFESSPDFCAINKSLGTLGTGGRRCDRDSKGVEGCAILCCGKGYDTRRELFAEKCSCKFNWCCKVKCKVCREWKDVYTCKHSI